ncbi:MAG: hypothetical protein V1774_05225 [Candidatus Eisenbacteria bacterium]
MNDETKSPETKRPETTDRLDGSEGGALWKTLDVEGDPRLPRDLWPLIEARVHHAARRGVLLLRLGGAAAAVAGLLLGVFLGSPLTPRGDSWQQETWAELGSLLTEENEATLDNIYLSMAEEGGEE